MATFSEFLNSFDPDSKGKQFEHFAKWFLKNDPGWSTQVDKVWLWDEYPERWGRDCGVDLVFKHKNNDIWAVQAKCYSPEYSIKKTDVDKFLNESDRQGIDKRLLIASTDQIGLNARQVIDAKVERPVTCFLFSDFDKSGIEYPSHISKLKTAKRKTPPPPRKHQLKAVDAVEKGFKETDRGQLIMACGTGKTFTTLWIKEKLSAESTLVLVPSLSLLSQTLREWTFACKVPFDVLCVCSDQSVGKRGNEDEIILSAKDLSFPVTSDPQEISSFLRGKRNKVIFSTYQSSPLIAESQSNLDVPMFNLVVADEAHRCTGKVESEFTTVLDNKKIRAIKRLFVTATPRTYSVSVKRSASKRGVDITSMDDEVVFGKEFYTLTFGEAIELKLLTDYQVVIVGVDDLTIANWIERRELVQTDSGHITDADSLASQIGLIKAIKDYDLKRMISFHSRVKRAETFASEIKNTINFVSEKNHPGNSIWTDFISGQMNAYKRRLKLEQLKELTKEDRGLLSNAKCLSEGVDIPSLDGIAFIDPRKSQVDIVQAVGRALRLDSKKKAGTIVLPVFIKDNQNAEKSIQASNFKPVWDVLNALRSHDNLLAYELDQLRTKLGTKKRLTGSDDEFSKILFDLPTSVDKSFSDSLKTYLVEKTTSSWNFWFGLLENYLEREGHVKVLRHENEDGHKLGGWVHIQRQQKKLNILTADRIKRLEALPNWSWTPFADSWEEGFSHLLKFVEKNDHVRGLGRIKIDGYALGSWVKTQRLKKDLLSPDKVKRLEALPKWSWDVYADRWEEGFSQLNQFAKQNGHARIPRGYKTKDGVNLATWVITQRENRVSMPPDRIKRLEALPKWSWDVYADRWEEGFSQLNQFMKQNGHARVPKNFKTKDGFSLTNWVGVQRKNKDTLTPDQITRLEALPKWSWDALKDKWEDKFSILVKFVEQNGHARVPKNFKTKDGFSLTNWVGVQRKNKDTLTPDRITRLEALPKWSWDVLKDQWEEGFSQLNQFVKQNGHARVPLKFKTEDGFTLRNWITVQRKNKDTLTPDRITRLEALPKWSWDVLKDQWEEGFSDLVKFAEQNGHARVPDTFKTETGFRLGTWVLNKRSNKNDTLTPDQITKLEALPKWSWDVLKDQWEEGFSDLVKFAEQNGHARVPKIFKTKDGFNLGNWVASQRRKYRKSKLHPNQVRRLQKLDGWVWDLKK